MEYVAKHPHLVESHIDIAMPKQKSNELLLQYHQNWMHYLHVMCLCGVLLSDGYFVESFLRNLHGVCNSTIKPLMLHFVRCIAVDVALPHYFHPANVLLCVATAATNVGVVGMTPVQTPNDFANSCCQ